MSTPLMTPPYTSRALHVSADRCVNLYPETSQGKIAFLPRRALKAEITIPSSPKYVFTFYGGILGIVSITGGGNVYTSKTSPEWTVSLGTIPDNYIDAATGYFPSQNAGTIVFVNGSNGFTLTGALGTVTGISDGDFQAAASVCQMDGYWIFTRDPAHFDSQQNGWFWSDLNDPTSYSALSRAFALSSPILRSCATLHHHLYLLGSETVEIWTNTGASATLPFEMDAGATIPIGIAGALCRTVTDKSLYFVGQAVAGWPAIYRITDYTVEKISTPLVDKILQSWGAAKNHRMFTEIQYGHTFVHVVPTVSGVGTETSALVYDETESMWAERSYASGTTESGARITHHIFVPSPRSTTTTYPENFHLFGGPMGAKLYGVTDTASTDDGATIYRRRSAPFDSPSGKRLQWNAFRAFVQSTGADGTTTLSWSDTGGTAYTSRVVTEAAGAANERWMRWNALGSSRGRIWRIENTGNIGFSLFDTDIDVQEMRA